MIWIPNFLTIARMIAALAFPLVSPGWWVPIVFFALATEYLDGKLARSFNWETVLGQLLDPIADKVFSFSVGLTLVFAEKLKWYEFLFISVKDISVIFVFLVVLFSYRSKGNIGKFKPNMAGKITTAFQYMVFVAAVFSSSLVTFAVYLAGFSACVSATSYISNFVDELHLYKRRKE